VWSSTTAGGPSGAPEVRRGARGEPKRAESAHRGDMGKRKEAKAKSAGGSRKGGASGGSKRKLAASGGSGHKAAKHGTAHGVSGLAWSRVARKAGQGGEGVQMEHAG
jgi:hypothetical protein